MTKVVINGTAGFLVRRLAGELGKAIEATGNMDSVVLEIIREKDPLKEINDGMNALKNKGWKLKT